jgi:predicted TPR repeat methyltransferase
LCAQLNTLDPNCVEARLVVGDGHAAIQDWTQAAHWYQKAGELGTGAGAIGWFRAAQCHDLAGDPAAALNAMGHCLELDTTAVEPRTSLSAAAGHAA